METYSPMMQKYVETKEGYKDAILFYRLGDFYEMFFDDAITVSRELEITLTGKACGLEEKVPMAGVPHHSAEGYITKLVEKGYKVAICEQLTDPKETRGIVERGVVRVVTPGTLVDSSMLEERKNNYIMSIYKAGIFFGICICDISTGEMYGAEIKKDNNFQQLLDELARYNPKEIVINKMMFESEEQISKIKERFEVHITNYEQEKFDVDEEKVYSSLKVFDKQEREIKSLDKKDILIASINGLVEYLKETQKTSLDHINKITIYDISKYMSLDINARRNLELVERMKDKSKKGTLLWVLDKTATSMGARGLRRWINDPLVDSNEIKKRLEAVEEIKNDIMLKGELVENLKKVYDIERLAAKMAYGNANARDMITLKSSIAKIPELKQLLKDTNSELLKEIYENMDELKDVYDLIDLGIEEEPPTTIKDGGIIKLGYDEQIDELKIAKTEGQKWIIDLEVKEKELSGIKNLKVGFNKIFGYYIEITKSFLNQVPERYIRKQTLSNAERFITEELKTLEEKTLGAEEKVIILEHEAFLKIRSMIAQNVIRMQSTSMAIASLDILVGFSTVAEDLNYSKPEINTEGIIDIKEGRHPVVEKILGAGQFIDNDTYIDKEENRVSIITGPNMAGKSTYMRQVALITLMAQIGSFVPASFANIGVVDKIFTRVGASDDLATGQSTFMVEMMEVATILKEATNNSLVILDEIGRGTSTYDGVSIAWAVAEYMVDKQRCGAKTIFATHYHELIRLEEKFEGIKNFSVAVKEKGEEIQFLRKIVEGGTDDSYGIHVAKLAGVPKDVLKRANEMLKTLEKKDIIGTRKTEKSKQMEGQVDMFNYKIAELSSEIDKIDVHTLTPMEAMNILYKIKEKIS